MLQVKQLDQYYGDSHTLWTLDMQAPAGKCTVLMGRNGVGKTTLLQCIMGLLPVRSGEICYGQHDLLAFTAEQRARLGIAYVPQGRQIFPLLTVEENLLIGLPARRKTKEMLHPTQATDQDNGIPAFIFDLFPVLNSMLKRRGGDLSGGQQQQLAIARALVLNPEFLILDEPTEGIQPNIVHEIGDIICKLNREMGLTVLLVEQKLPFARRVGDCFCILDRGRKVCEGEMAQLDDKIIKQYLTV